MEKLNVSRGGMLHAPTSQRYECLRLMGKKFLIALAMEGKFAGGGLQSLDEDDDMLTSMAKEPVEKNGIGEAADAVWKQLNGGASGACSRRERNLTSQGQNVKFNRWFQEARRCGQTVPLRWRSIRTAFLCLDNGPEGSRSVRRLPRRPRPSRVCCSTRTNDINTRRSPERTRSELSRNPTLDLASNTVGCANPARTQPLALTARDRARSSRLLLY